jgi:peptide chain release factor 1
VGTPAWLLDDDALLAQCEVQAHRASGPGGQHRNKAETAVRLVHLPTGVTVEGKDERSRTSNLRIALQRLRDRLEKRAYRPPPRHKTRPTRASKERRVEGKKRHAQKKALRRGSYE